MYDKDLYSEALHKVKNYLGFVYPGSDIESLALKLLMAMGLQEEIVAPKSHHNNWDERDIIAITYGDSFNQPQECPLKTLLLFLDTYLADTINSVHILPFYPYSSDDGFAVIDYRIVNDSLGDWRDINAIAKRYKLMSDLVINHCSSRSGWFENYKQRKEPGKDFFFEASVTEDLSQVVRPRTSDLLMKVQTLDGERHVWCTFGHDQVDFDFRNPAVLIEFVNIIRFYLEQGVKLFRLDAVAFIWKEIGSDCLNLPQTHEIIRLLRALIEYKDPHAVIITETNIPNRENLAYFGNANEAHVIYNFSLPPLLVHAMITSNCHYLKNWMMSMPPAQNGTAYLNFIASHDGIGLRPIEGILSESETDQLVNTMQSFGGQISWRALDKGRSKPYEVNISLFDAMRGTVKGPDCWQVERFMCAHAIMLALEGIPAIYIHSFLATGNDYEKLEHTGRNRSINRHKWDFAALESLLADNESQHAVVLSRLKQLINIRTRQPAFHPNATQFTLHLGDSVFAFWRQSQNRDQSIFAINNISDQPQVVPLCELNLIELDKWSDLISGQEYVDLDKSLELVPYQTVWLTNKLA